MGKKCKNLPILEKYVKKTKKFIHIKVLNDPFRTYSTTL